MDHRFARPRSSLAFTRGKASPISLSVWRTRAAINGDNGSTPCLARYDAAAPEELLQQVQAEEDYERHGRLKVFLGYA